MLDIQIVAVLTSLKILAHINQLFVFSILVQIRNWIKCVYCACSYHYSIFSCCQNCTFVQHFPQILDVLLEIIFIEKYYASRNANFMAAFLKCSSSKHLLKVLA